MDSGSRFMKLGHAGEEYPRYVVPSLVATDRQDSSHYVAGWEAKGAAQESSRYKLGRAFDPLDPDWDLALAMWEHVYATLQVAPHGQPVMLTETPDMSVAGTPLRPPPPTSHPSGREETLQIFFEYFNVPSLYIGNSALMSLYGIGQLEGLVVEVGTRAQVVPVLGGGVERAASVQVKRGLGVDRYLASLLEEKGIFLTTERELDEVPPHHPPLSPPTLTPLRCAT